MHKQSVLCIFLLFVIFVLPSCAGKVPTVTEPGTDLSTEWELETAQESKLIKVGMTSNEAREALDAVGAKYFEYVSMIFFEDPDGMNGIAYIELKDNFQVVEVDTFPRVEPTHEAFQSVTVGMPVAALVRKAGLPSDSLTSGFASICFRCADGTRYSVYIDRGDLHGNSDSAEHWYVLDYRKLKF